MKQIRQGQQKSGNLSSYHPIGRTVVIVIALARIHFWIFLCLVVSLTIGVSAVKAEVWMSFTGFDHPTPAEIQVMEQSRDTILVEMTLDGVNVRGRKEHGQQFQFLSVPQADWTNETGKPKLPVLRTLLMIPSVNDVEIQIEDENYTILKGYNVYPVGRKVVKYSSDGTVYEAFYSTNSFYPQKVANISFSGYLRAQRLIQLELHPIRYNPRLGELMCYSFLRVQLIYGGGIGTGAGVYSPTSLVKVLKHEFANYAKMAPSVLREGNVSYPDNFMANYKADYIIIAPELFYNSDALQRLANWRAHYSGLDVAVASTTKIYDNFSGALDESIRSFIQYVYDFWDAEHIPDGHVGYILLVGDVEFLPVHISEQEIFDKPIATDNWYVCVSGDDLMPDIMLGRLPANNEAELNIMIDKTIQYEKKPLYGEWSNNALLMLGTIESMHEDIEHLRDEYWLLAGYNVSEVSALDGGNAVDVNSELNRGQHIVYYAGHGQVNGWEIFHDYDIPELTNERSLPAIFSMACSTGHFDHPDKDSLGEAFLKASNGAIAFFGSSGVTTSSGLLGVGLSEAVAELNIYTPGEIVIHIKLKTLWDPFDLELYNLLGDPALDLGAPRRQPGKADLVVSPADIFFEPQQPKQGEQVKITVIIHNLGVADARDVIVELKDDGAQVGITYWYIVRTSDGRYLSANFEPVSACSLNNFAPKPPETVYAQKGSIDNTIDIRWVAGEEVDIAGYKVYKGVSSMLYGEPIDVGVTDHYVLTGLTNGTVILPIRHRL